MTIKTRKPTNSVLKRNRVSTVNAAGYVPAPKDLLSETLDKLTPAQRDGLDAYSMVSSLPDDMREYTMACVRAVVRINKAGAR